MAGDPKRTPKVPAAGTTQSFLVAQLGAPVHLGSCAELDESYSAIDVSMLKKSKQHGHNRVLNTQYMLEIK